MEQIKQEIEVTKVVLEANKKSWDDVFVDFPHTFVFKQYEFRYGKWFSVWLPLKGAKGIGN